MKCLLGFWITVLVSVIVFACYEKDQVDKKQTQEQIN